VDPAFTGGQLSAAASLNGTLYVGGSGGLFRLAATTLQPVGSVTGGPVLSLLPLLGSLYVGGEFTSVGSPVIALPRLARWTGTQWLAVAPTNAGNFSFGSVRTLAGDATGIVAGSAFDVATAAGVAQRLARFDGVVWQRVTLQTPDAPVDALLLEANGGTIAGAFTRVGAVQSFSVASWLSGPVFVGSPQPLAICDASGGPAVFSVRALAGVTPLYQWRRNGVPLADDLRITGSATDTLTINAPTPPDAGTYDCVVTNCGNAASAPALLTVAQRCGPSDVAGSGQSVQPCGDGELTADDVIVFVAWFIVGDARADVGRSGQQPGGDGEFTADDLIVFVNRFVQGC
jgi:hypothetical protein